MDQRRMTSVEIQAFSVEEAVVATPHELSICSPGNRAQQPVKYTAR